MNIIKDTLNKERLRNESINSQAVLNKSLEDNVNLFMEFFQGDDTVSVRYFSNREQENIKFCIIYINGMVDVETANVALIKPIIQSTFPKNFEGNMDVILGQVIISNNAEKLCNIDELVVRILRGESVLLMDKCD